MSEREVDILNTPEKPLPWSQQLRLAVEGRGYRIMAWKEVGEGAVAGVIANHALVDPVAYIINGPTDLTSRTEFDLWGVLSQHRDILPDTIAYNQWGTSLDNKNTQDTDRYSAWITNGEEFIHSLRDVRRQERQDMDDLW